MGQLGLKSTVGPKRYQSYKGDIGKAAPNLLERNFATSKPNQKWVTDVTEFNIKSEKVYHSPILDLYNQEIISYEIADRPQISSVMQMLQRAFKQHRPTDKLLLHSDQGWQYQMGFYQEALKKQGITQSMSRKGNRLDNAAMENWFVTMEAEFFYRKRFESIESFKRELEEYIPKKRQLSTLMDEELRMIQDQLNNRPRKRLGFKTPSEVFMQSLNRAPLRQTSCRLS